MAAGAQPARILRVSLAADPLDERPEAPADARRLELVAEDGCQRHGQGRALVEQVEQRQIAARQRLPQPLLSERPGPEALDVGHVRVEHDRQHSPL